MSRRNLSFAIVLIFIGFGGGFVTRYATDRVTDHVKMPNENRSIKEMSDEDLARYTLWLMIFTGVLAVATIGLGLATFGLYRTGEKQVGVTRDALIGDQRAWLVTKLEVGETGLTVENGDISLDVRLKISNVGRTPALDAHTNMELVEDATSEMIRDLASDNKKTSSHGLFVSPNDFYYRPWRPSLIENDKYHQGVRRRIQPILIGCVTYRILQDDHLHQIAFAYLVGKKDGTPWGGDVTFNNVRLNSDELTITPWTGGFAT